MQGAQSVTLSRLVEVCLAGGRHERAHRSLDVTEPKQVLHAEGYAGIRGHLRRCSTASVMLQVTCGCVVLRRRRGGREQRQGWWGLAGRVPVQFTISHASGAAWPLHRRLRTCFHPCGETAEQRGVVQRVVGAMMARPAARLAAPRAARHREHFLWQHPQHAQPRDDPGLVHRPLLQGAGEAHQHRAAPRSPHGHGAQVHSRREAAAS